MRSFRFAIPLILLHLPALAGTFTVHVTAPHDAGKVIMLYRYDDLFTLRTIRMAEALLDDAGKATLTGEVSGTGRMQLRIGDDLADLYARPGSVLNVEWPGRDPLVPRSLNRTNKVPIAFTDMAPLDINALTSDLNERLDDFLLEDLATDAVAGMQAVEVKRKDTIPGDTTQRPATLFVTPDMSAARIDTFEHKLRRFYAGIDDPWFDRYLEYGVAGLRQGPRANDSALYVRYLKERPVLYDNPEYVRWLRDMFDEHLVAYGYRYHANDLKHALAVGDMDSVKTVLARHDFLQHDDRLAELVMLDQIYLGANSKLFPRDQLLRILEQATQQSMYAEHRVLARNMFWDLSAMSQGSELPPMLLEDLNGDPVDDLMEGPVCLMFTATWCTYCELEVAGMEQLQKEYNGLIPIVMISLDKDLETLGSYLKLHPNTGLRWLHAEAEQQLREDLRLRSLPAVILLQDGVLVASPAPLPSHGLGEIFHKARVQAEEQGKTKVWDD
jgi:thiol-disulfide isomerase/thioredoxin